MCNAAFTITKNESILLPIWLSYYGQFFAKEDMYVLDHESTDGSTEDLECNHIIIRHEYSWDNTWMCQQVNAFAKKLLLEKKYKNVLLAETDEIVCPDPNKYSSLKEYIERNNRPAVCMNTYQVVHDCTFDKKTLDPSKTILSQRKWYFETHPNWNKTLLIQKPVNWGEGFHFCDEKSYHDPDLYLIHLHHMDLDVAHKRAVSRTMGFKVKDGSTNTNTEKNYIHKELKDRLHLLTEIPERFRSII
jgi:hypothetical protein